MKTNKISVMTFLPGLSGVGFTLCAIKDNERLRRYFRRTIRSFLINDREQEY